MMSSSRVLVTGAGGFIGSHVVEELLNAGCTVMALVKYSSTGNWGWLSRFEVSPHPNLQVVLGDIRDTEQVIRLVQSNDIIINLAALIGIPYSYTAARSYMEVNLFGCLNLLEGIKATDKKLVQISTSEVYGTPISVPIQLTHPICPQSPYAASKVAADQLCRSYSKSFDVNSIVVRPFNTFGPRQSRRAVIPTLISQIVSGLETVKLGSLWPKRDMTYVTDTANGIVRAALSQVDPGSELQLGTGRSVTVLQIAEILKKLTNKDFEIIEDVERVRPIGSEVAVLESDPHVARDILGWEAKTSLEDGLWLTYQWYLDNPGELRRVGKYEQ